LTHESCRFDVRASINEGLHDLCTALCYGFVEGRIAAEARSCVDVCARVNQEAHKFGVAMLYRVEQREFTPNAERFLWLFIQSQTHDLEQAVVNFGSSRCDEGLDDLFGEEHAQSLGDYVRYRRLQGNLPEDGRVNIRAGGNKNTRIIRHETLRESLDRFFNLSTCARGGEDFSQSRRKVVDKCCDRIGCPVIVKTDVLQLCDASL